jgi:hypothetical protein
MSALPASITVLTSGAENTYGGSLIYRGINVVDVYRIHVLDGLKQSRGLINSKSEKGADLAQMGTH